MWCSPWQVVQTGASRLPLRSAAAWALEAYSAAIVTWHLAHVSGNVLLVDPRAGDQARFISWLPWQSTQLAALTWPRARAEPCTLSLKGRDKMPAEERLARDRRFFEVAGFAEGDLRELQVDAESARRRTGDGLPMAGQAVWRIFRALSQGLTMGGGEKLVALRFVTAAARGRLPRGREGKIRRLDRGNGMRAVAGDAGGVLARRERRVGQARVKDVFARDLVVARSAIDRRERVLVRNVFRRKAFVAIGAVQRAVRGSGRTA